ncbi:MAG: VWA domain-containing protein [Gammaproteobacteria bacterium]|nr:VWA domain-containing protein [Gammaproteobacteria bacterium]MCY4219698.1 VWA domain-containing protein [Gammaproteobacteria bacterium]
MPKSRPVTSPFGLAFLDVMACGLGAVTLIFMLVKYNTNVSEAETDHGNLDSEIAEMRAEQEASEQQLAELVAEYRSLTKQTEDQQIRMASRVDQEEGKEKKLQQLRLEVQALEKAAEELKQAKSEEPAPIIESPGPTQHHLLGIRVEGKRILILIDSSSSMTNSRIVDIVTTQVSDDATKQKAPKWQRTLRAVNWIIERVPEGSQYMIVFYAKRADFLIGNRWIKSNDSKQTQRAMKALSDLVPNGSTNLHSAIEFIIRQSINPSNIYLITDGLPTLGPIPKLTTLASLGCNPTEFSKSTISGACRLALFVGARELYNTNIKASLNTILMPLEGDPHAIYSYWTLASNNGGTVTSPGVGWP